MVGHAYNHLFGLAPAERGEERLCRSHSHLSNEHLYTILVDIRGISRSVYGVFYIHVYKSFKTALAAGTDNLLGCIMLVPGRTGGGVHA